MADEAMQRGVEDSKIEENRKVRGRKDELQALRSREAMALLIVFVLQTSHGLF